ncbi:hypothetical protein D9M68_808250 [compost metagenome]
MGQRWFVDAQPLDRAHLRVAVWIVAVGLELVFPADLADGAELKVPVADHQKVARFHAGDKNRYAGHGVVGLWVFYLKTVGGAAVEHIASRSAACEVNGTAIPQQRVTFLDALVVNRGVAA